MVTTKLLTSTITWKQKARINDRNQNSNPRCQDPKLAKFRKLKQDSNPRPYGIRYTCNFFAHSIINEYGNPGGTFGEGTSLAPRNTRHAPAAGTFPPPTALTRTYIHDFSSRPVMHPCHLHAIGSAHAPLPRAFSSFFPPSFFNFSASALFIRCDCSDSDQSTPQDKRLTGLDIHHYSQSQVRGTGFRDPIIPRTLTSERRVESPYTAPLPAEDSTYVSLLS